MSLEYVIGAELPDAALTWTDSDNTVIPFASGYTFTVKIGNPPAVADLTKTTGITGANTAPNLTIIWSAGELDSLPRGQYSLQVFARNTASGKDRVMQIPIRLKAAVA